MGSFILPGRRELGVPTERSLAFFQMFFRTLLLFLGLLSSAWSQEQDVAVEEAPGPWIFGTVRVGSDDDQEAPATTALKGLAIRVGAQAQAAVAYDLDLCRMLGAWTGGKLTTPMRLPPQAICPTALGRARFVTDGTVGLRSGEDAIDAEGYARLWIDPRAEPYGPLPSVHYRGLSTSGGKVMLRWDFAGTEVLEVPNAYAEQHQTVFTRSFQVAPHEHPLWILCVSTSAGGDANFQYDPQEGETEPQSTYAFDTLMAVHVPPGTHWRVSRWGNWQTYLVLPPEAATCSFTIGLGAQIVAERNRRTDHTLVEEVRRSAQWEFGHLDFANLLQGGTGHSPETVETRGEISRTQEAYVVDTIKLPEAGAGKLPISPGGLDFFPDGRAALCSVNGDVFIVSGLDEKLEHVTWKRFATGLFLPLGLKIVDGEIYVTEQSGITRLRDLNGDGEADFYEPWNWEVKVTKNPREWACDLQTDRVGNFWFTKAAPVKSDGRGFDEICEHHGTLLRVAPDGKKLETYATGFCTPGGVSIGPEGQITSEDSQEPWMSASRLNWITQSGFYGCAPTAHWAQPPPEAMKPLCWLPKQNDGAPGSQVWVTSNRWGPWEGQLLHLSPDTGRLFGVMMEQTHVPKAPECCEYVMQGGVTAFPLLLQRGVMRARFHPVDGQLYVAGLRGWGTSKVEDGILQRVRYTGLPTHMPIGLSAQREGMELKFTTSLDTQRACDPENWSVEVWNYHWPDADDPRAASPLGFADKTVGGDVPPGQLSQPTHEFLKVSSVTMGTDDQTVFLQITGLQPTMQMNIKYRLRSADCLDLPGEVVNTIHALVE